jgi:hypothetical protein
MCSPKSTIVGFYGHDRLKLPADLRLLGSRFVHPRIVRQPEAVEKPITPPQEELHETKNRSQSDR